MALRSRLRAALLAGGLALAGGAGPALAAGEALPPPDTNFSFDGLFGTFDRASAQRGFQVYKEVCSGCHSMKLVYYRNLGALGFSEAGIGEHGVGAGHPATWIVWLAHLRPRGDGGGGRESNPPTAASAARQF